MTGQTLETLRTAFHLPREQAAVALGLTVNELKKALKQLNIARWPYRKLASLQSLHQDLEQQLQQFASTGGNDPGIQAHIRDLQEMQARIAEDSAKIIQDPNTPLDEALHKLRLQNYKARFLGRHGHLSAPPMLRLPPNAGASNASATASANTTAAGGIGAGDMTGVETNTGQQGGTLGALSVDVKTEPGTDGGDTESTQSVGRRRRAASIVASTHIKRAAGLVGGESDDEESQLAQAVSKPRLAGRGTGGSAGRPFARAPQVGQRMGSLGMYQGPTTLAALPSLPEGAAFYDTTAASHHSRHAQSAPLYDDLNPGAAFGGGVARTHWSQLAVLNESVAAINLQGSAPLYFVSTGQQPGGGNGSSGTLQSFGQSRQQGVPSHLLPPRPGSAHPPAANAWPPSAAGGGGMYTSAPVFVSAFGNNSHPIGQPHHTGSQQEFRAGVYSEASSTAVSSHFPPQQPHHAVSLPALPSAQNAAGGFPGAVGGGASSGTHALHGGALSHAAFTSHNGGAGSSNFPSVYGAGGNGGQGRDPRAFFSQQLQGGDNAPWPPQPSRVPAIPVAETLVTPLEELLGDWGPGGASAVDPYATSHNALGAAANSGAQPPATAAGAAQAQKPAATGAASRRPPGHSGYFLLNNNSDDEEDSVLAALLAAPDGDTNASRLLGGNAHAPTESQMDASRWAQQSQQQSRYGQQPQGQQQQQQQAGNGGWGAPSAGVGTWGAAPSAPAAGQPGSVTNSCPVLPSVAQNTQSGPSGDRSGVYVFEGAGNAAGADNVAGMRNLQTISASPRPPSTMQDAAAPRPAFSPGGENGAPAAPWSMQPQRAPSPMVFSAGVAGMSAAEAAQATRLAEENARLQAQLAAQQQQLEQLQAQLARNALGIAAAAAAVGGGNAGSPHSSGPAGSAPGQPQHSGSAAHTPGTDTTAASLAQQGHTLPQRGSTSGHTNDNNTNNQTNSGGGDMEAQGPGEATGEDGQAQTSRPPHVDEDLLELENMFNQGL